MSFVTSLGSFALGVVLLATGCAHADRPPDTSASVATHAPVVVVLSAAQTQTLADGTTRPTGFFLNEFYEVKRGLDDAGVPYVIATVGGDPPALDPESLNEKYWSDHPTWRTDAIAWFEEAPEVRAPVDISTVASNADGFAGLVVPGGQGVMVDLLHNETLHGLIVQFGASARPVGLVCHAPALLAQIPQAQSPFVGRRVTSVSGIEELYIERVVMGAKATDRKIGRSLRRAGFRHRNALPGRPKAIRDGNLITSQNPFSGDAFVELYLAALAEL